MHKVKVEPAAIFQLEQNRPLTNCLAAMTYSTILFLYLPTARTYLSISNNLFVCIQEAVKLQVTVAEQSDVQALVVEELRRLHEGVLARYGLRPSEFDDWKIARLATANKNPD